QFGSYAGKDFPFSTLGGPLIEDWAAHLREEGYSPASMRRKIVVLKVFCSYWVRRGDLAESPFWRVKLSFGRIDQLPRALSETEMRGLLTQAKRSQSAFQIPRKGSVVSNGKSSNPSNCQYRYLR